MHDIGKMATDAGRDTRLRWLAETLAAVVLLAGLLTVASPAQAADLPWGPYTCATGYVWREAVPGDQVCVTPQTRSDTQTENALGPSRREPNGFCKVGFVWRETRSSDLVCVFPSSRDRAYSDNANAPWRLVDPGATPRGGVSVTTTNHQLGGYLYATGSGLSPNRPVRFYAVRINTVGPYSLGSLTANSSGAISGWQYVADIRCRSGLTEPAIIVVLDQGSGVVTTAGTTDAFRRCG
ncbi:hypothetical protein ABT023_09050 [Micromonospora sp. NPDC002296]|uniref:hypothetical protein n=1 Tax=Micromonospora sp. NPDC002296 TaxID=3154271 RepID=UPI003318040A